MHEREEAIQKRLIEKFDFLAEHCVVNRARRLTADAPREHLLEVAQFLRELLRGLLLEIAAIGHAADDGETPLARVHGELRCRHHGPRDELALEVGVRGVALVVRQAQFAPGELAGQPHLFQALLERGIHGRIGQHARDGLTRLQDLELAARGLGHVHRAAAAQHEAGGDQ